jgi:hypothetical protein
VDAIDPIVRTPRQEDPRPADPISPRDLRKILPFEPAATSAWLGWPDLAAVTGIERFVDGGTAQV